MGKRVKKDRTKENILRAATAILVVLSLGVFKWLLSPETDHSAEKDKTVTITNVSYDPTRELYQSYNQLFQKYWKAKTGESVKINQSHGGSGSQANSVISGNKADVVTLALSPDITSIEDAGLIDKGWEKKLPDDAAPYTSTIVFLVRKGNPKNINDWSDLIKKEVAVITPNPKTSGGARWNYLAAWAYADQTNGHQTEQTEQFVKKLYQNVKVLDASARAATTTFTENGQGDVLVAWENEAYLALKDHPDKYEIITPSISIKAEPTVAVVDGVAEERHTTKIAQAYLKYLYSEKAQKIAAENYYRPSNEKVAAEYADRFAKVKMISINDQEFGGWAKVQKKHFAENGIFDQIYKK